MSDHTENHDIDIDGPLELQCQQCGVEFRFSENEQRFYSEMGFVTPRYCPACRKNRKKTTTNRKNDDWKEYYDVVCEKCGKETSVPFKPVNGRPVYCRECLGEFKEQGNNKTNFTENISVPPPQTLSVRGMGYSRMRDSERPYDELESIVESFLDEHYPD